MKYFNEYIENVNNNTNNKIIVGELKLFWNDYNFGYVFDKLNNKLIILENKIKLNRCFEYDIVYVEEEYNFNKENYYNKLESENTLNIIKINELKNTINSFYKNNIIYTGKVVNVNVDVDVDVNDLTLKNKKIVGVLNIQSKYNYGINKQNIKIYKFFPYNKKYPCFYVASSINKNKTIKNDVYAEILFKEWKETSNFPIGTCEKILGEIGVKESEYNYILSIYEFNFVNHKNENYLIENEFNLNNKKQIKMTGTDFEFENELINKVKDYNYIDKRDLNIISIDPPDCKDIDDALSIEILDNYYLFSIHIADVSTFVLPDTLLDKMAFERVCSVYAPHKQINMLPDNLSMDKCSLLENKIRLSLTTIFKCDKDFNIIDKYFEKQIMKCSFNLNYDIVDCLLDKMEFKKINNSKKKILKKYPSWITNYLELFKKFIIHNNILNIKENEINSHNIVSSLMVLTNNYVGFILYSNTHLLSLLRIHNSNIEEEKNNNSLKTNVNILELFHSKKDKLGINIQNDNKENKEHLLKLETFLNIFVSKSASYINHELNENENNETIFHKGLNIQFYTHFTSPLRRYWDILVHREITKYLEKTNTNTNISLNENENNKFNLIHINERSKINKLCHRTLKNYEFFFNYFNINELEEKEDKILNSNAFIINIKHNNELLLFFPDLEVSFNFYPISNQLLLLYDFISSETELKLYDKQKKEYYIFHLFDYLNFNIIFNKNECLDKKIKLNLLNSNFKLFIE